MNEKWYVNWRGNFRRLLGAEEAFALLCEPNSFGRWEILHVRHSDILQDLVPTILRSNHEGMIVDHPATDEEFLSSI